MSSARARILTGRTVKGPEGNDTPRSLLVPQLQHQAWRDAPSALKLDVSAPGTLDSLQFVEDSEHENELGPQEVEIEAKPWGLNFRDVLIALGRS
ncbi:hypothetical protein B0T26DRAFT_650534 [Lasiosphaeria miniovina]|uniref:Polyketide synthase n=1 Tax=Lasiosphaeria miniovina TaxID=1954250 RepID=A0AA40AB21_9PEZI|nr:uncharacterized protein B0T26DRAFT_650534 [Lasiosphaeria miniovina]KAK0712602.1 hypothetical protein B0T26DRAFT_650534 [Lasiosphaeria miniovina]